VLGAFITLDISSSAFWRASSEHLISGSTPVPSQSSLVSGLYDHPMGTLNSTLVSIPTRVQGWAPPPVLVPTNLALLVIFNVNTKYSAAEKVNLLVSTYTGLVYLNGVQVVVLWIILFCGRKYVSSSTSLNLES